MVPLVRPTSFVAPNTISKHSKREIRVRGSSIQINSREVRKSREVLAIDAPPRDERHVPKQPAANYMPWVTLGSRLPNLRFSTIEGGSQCRRVSTLVKVRSNNGRPCATEWTSSAISRRIKPLRYPPKSLVKHGYRCGRAARAVNHSVYTPPEACSLG